MRTLACVSNTDLKLAGKGGGAGDWRKLRNEDIRYVALTAVDLIVSGITCS